MNPLINTLLIIVMAISFSFAQEKPEDLEPDEQFVYLYDNTLLRNGDFSIEKGFLTKKFYDDSGSKIDLRDIKFFQDDDGYFGSFKAKTIFGQTTTNFVKRYEAGRIDLFYKSDYTYNSNTNTNTRSNTFYYAFGFNDIHLLSYKNLKRDLTKNFSSELSRENQLILSHLEKGNRNRKTSFILLGSGLAVSIAGGLIWQSGDNENNNNKRLTGLAISGVGLVGMVTSLFIKDEKHYLRAVQTYNDTYEYY